MYTCQWYVTYFPLFIRTEAVSTDNSGNILSQVSLHPPESISVEKVHVCTGTTFSWNIEWILESYPFSIHRPGSRIDPGYDLLSIDVVASVIRVRSGRCTGSRMGRSAACPSCLGLGPSVNVVRTWAQEFPGKKPSTRLSHDQLVQRLNAAVKQVKNERLKVRVQNFR